MAFDFPNAPGAGQTVTGPQGQTYQWDGTKWASYGAGTAYAPLASPVFTGDARAVTPAYGDNDTSIPTTAFVQSAVAPVANNTGRNLVMNGAFAVQQRGAGPWSADGGYTADRWGVDTKSDTVSITCTALADADRSSIGDETARYALQNVFTGSAAATTYNAAWQRIEGVRRLSAKTITLSFWAKAASGAPRLGINLLQLFGSGGSPSAAVWALATGNAITLSTTWARYSSTITIPSVSGKTLGTNGDDWTGVYFFYSAGANTNATAGNIGVQSGTVQLYGCQLEIGTQATPLDYGGSPQQQLAQCQRFYQAGIRMFQIAYQASGGNFGTGVALPVVMRAAPTVTPTTNGNANIGTLNLSSSPQFATAYAAATATGTIVIDQTMNLSADL